MNDRSSLERRDFLKLVLAGTAGAAAAACQPHSRVVAPLLIPEQQLPSGVAFWSRGLCRQCPAGCGVLVKRMEAIVPLTVEGKPYRQSRLVAKKLEGNPDHPLNRGGLCARGQAGLEATYQPQRLRVPLRRAGARGSGDFRPASWATALAGLRQSLGATRPGDVAWLGRPLRGTEAEVVGGWLQQIEARWWTYEALPAPRAMPAAARLARLPEADFVLSFGNFLESWPGQAGSTRAYSRFRRAGGVFYQVEPRMSLTAASADRWVAVRPGTEGVFALGVAAQLLAARVSPLAWARAAVPEWLARYTPAEVHRLCDVPARQVVQTARALAAARRPLVVGGPAAYAYPHAGFQADAIEYLAQLAEMGEGGDGTVSGSPVEEQRPAAATPATSPVELAAAAIPFSAPLPPAPRLLIVHEVNPVFSAPPGWKLAAWLSAIPEIVVLGTLPDETVLQADLVLPLSTTLESWADDERPAPAGGVVATLNPPAMRPLHDTRALLEIVPDLSGATSPATAAPGGESGSAGDVAEAAIRRHWQGLQARYAPAQAFPAFWAESVERGGFWPAPTAAAVIPPTRATGPTGPSAGADAPALPPPGADYPLYLRLYESPIWGDGGGSWLTWLQELPDPTTSAMWCSWVEVHPQLAARLGLHQGDGVWIESSAGRIELPVLLYPGLRPDTVAIPTGQGHSAGQAITNRGGNPFGLLVAERDPGTGALAWEATRVRLTPSGRRPPLPLFGQSLQHPVTHR